MIHNNQSLLYVSYFWNFRNASCGSTGKYIHLATASGRICLQNISQKAPKFRKSWTIFDRGGTLQVGGWSWTNPFEKYAQVVKIGANFPKKKSGWKFRKNVWVWVATIPTKTPKNSVTWTKITTTWVDCPNHNHMGWVFTQALGIGHQSPLLVHQTGSDPHTEKRSKSTNLPRSLESFINLNWSLKNKKNTNVFLNIQNKTSSPPKKDMPP